LRSAARVSRVSLVSEEGTGDGGSALHPRRFTARQMRMATMSGLFTVLDYTRLLFLDASLRKHECAIRKRGLHFAVEIGARGVCVRI